MVATTIAAIDFENDGSFSLIDSGTDYDVLKIRNASGLTIERGRDGARMLSPLKAGKIQGTLDNTDRRFSPGNTSSPLYGYVVPGRRVRVQMVNGVTTYPIAWALLTDIDRNPGNLDRSASLDALGLLSELMSTEHGGSALYQNITTDVAFGYVLDAAGLTTSVAARTFSTGQTTLRWFWIAKGDNLFDIANTILNSEGPGASIYEGKAGTIHFEDRTYRSVTARCTTSQFTITDSGAEPHMADTPAPIYRDGKKDIINVVNLTHRTRVAQSLAEIWASAGTVTLDPFAVRTYPVVTSDGEPFTAAVTPTTGAGDYTLISGAVTPSLNRSSGSSATLTMTAGAAGCSYSAIRVRAQPVTVTYEAPVTSTIDTTASRANYRIKPYTLTTRAEIDIEVLQDFANGSVGLYQNPRPTFEITVQAFNAARLAVLLGIEISDRITIEEADSGVSEDYFVNSLYFNLNRPLQSVTMQCERTDGSSFWRLEIPGYSELDTTTILGF